MMKSKTHPFGHHAKGMAAAVFVGLLAVGAAAVIGVQSTLNEMDSARREPEIEEETLSFPDETAEWIPDSEKTDSTALQDKTDNEPAAETMTTPDTKETGKDKPGMHTLTGFVMPVTGEILTPYSNGQMIKSITLNDWRTHDGVDIAAKAGTPVKAANSGRVESAEMDPLWGAVIVLSHPDGTQSYYMGLDENLSVAKGASVSLGEVIGTVGKTAEIEQALPDHLHFAMKKDGNWINPLPDDSLSAK